MKPHNKWLMCTTYFVAVMAIILTIIASTTSPAAAHQNTSQGAAYPAVPAGRVITHCGIVSCSYYVSRDWTKKAYQKALVTGGGYAGSSTALCFVTALASGPVGPVTGVTCEIVAIVYGGWIFQEFQDAATMHGDKGACFKMTVNPAPFPYNLYFSTNNGTYCRDS